MAVSHLVASRRLNARNVGAALIAIALGAAGCDEPVGPIGDDVYVDVMARLAYAEARYIDPGRADSARRAVLEEAGVRPAELVAFAEMFGDDPDRMFELHERVRAVADSLADADTGALRGVPETDSIEEPGR